MLSLDTHIVIHFLEKKLAPDELELIRSNQCGFSCIVLWEIAQLAQLGRIHVGPDDQRLQAYLGTVTVWDLDLEVAKASAELDFRSDPANEIIAATSIVHHAPLLTRDSRIRASKIVPLAL